MSKTNVIKYAEEQGYETSLTDAIEMLVNEIMEMGYTKTEAKKMLATEIVAGWNVDSIISGIKTTEERANE